MDQVAVVECAKYKKDMIYNVISEGLKRIDFVVPEDKTVLIKPNLMTQNKANQHTVTHYTVLDAVCAILNEKNCRIIIADSISFYQNGLTKKAFRKSGMQQVAEKYHAQLIALEECRFQKISIENDNLSELYVPNVFFDVDMIIDLCKLKTHGTMRLSGAIKNMFGSLPGGYKQLIHRWTHNEFELADIFVALHQILKPSLSIMDAVIGLDGGPTAIGTPRQVSKILISENAASLDVVAAKLIGYDPRQLPILIQAKKRGMIEDFDQIDILGDYKEVRFKRLVPKNRDNKTNPNSFFVSHTYVDPYINIKQCNRCQRCIEECPVQAIKLIHNRTVINTELCIRCYHCIFVCPKHAVHHHSSVKNKLLRAVRLITRI